MIAMTALDYLCPTTSQFIKSLSRDAVALADAAAAYPVNPALSFSPYHMGKYIVIRRGTEEHPVLFPAAIPHNHMLPADAMAVSAGWFQILKTGDLLVGGESMTLHLESRPQDHDLIQSLLNKTV